MLHRGSRCSPNLCDDIRPQPSLTAGGGPSLKVLCESRPYLALADASRPQPNLI